MSFSFNRIDAAIRAGKESSLVPERPRPVPPSRKSSWSGPIWNTSYALWPAPGISKDPLDLFWQIQILTFKPEISSFLDFCWATMATTKAPLLPSLGPFIVCIWIRAHTRRWGMSCSPFSTVLYHSLLVSIESFTNHSCWRSEIFSAARPCAIFLPLEQNVKGIFFSPSRSRRPFV